MSLQVGFSAHSKALKSAYEQVIDNSSSVNWLIYTYDKGTNDLKVQATGEDGLEELSEEFIDGRIQYALARVTDPNTELPKLVFIAWCGTGVPESRKGLFNSHLNDVSKFFKSFHVQINARNEGDVDPAAIMKRVSDSSGANYSFHKETRRAEPAITPVNSVYKRTEIPDIAAMQRATMKSEPAPAPVNSVHEPIRTNPGKLASRWGSQPESEQNKIDQVRAERERAEKEAQDREQAMLAKRDQRAREEAARQEERQRALQAQQEEDSQRQQQEQYQREEEERQRQEALYQQQLQQEEEERVRHQAEEEERQRQEAEEEAERIRLQQEEEERHRFQFEEEERQRQEQAQLEAELAASAQHAAQTAEHAADVAAEPHRGNSLSAVVLFSYDAAEENEITMVEGEIIHNIEQLDEGWWSGVSEDGTRSGLFPSNYVQLLETQPESTEQASEPALEPEQVAQQAPAEPEGPSAVALYDYDAGEDNEITFKEGQVIHDIQFVSDDWWSGLAPDGTAVGLFPANYVELQQ
ncbi:actin binding protein [Umbelopsis nana]